MSQSDSVPRPHNYQTSCHPGISKRIIVCCDGTWQDGLAANQKWKYTNILRLARSVNHIDERSNPPVPQVVFYQSGVGTFGDRYVDALDGIVGASLGEKVQEAYAFIAHNYRPGDEIFLFGFSRGAYTARMIAALIGEIGVLDRTDMDSFAEIFVAYQKRGKAEDQVAISKLDKELEPWTQHTSPGKLRADSDKDSFSIKCVGVFDTVGSLGLPEELTLRSEKMRTLFGFPDLYLGEHIERAYQALALDEHRKDFDCAKWSQTEGGAKKGQGLKQCWFSGCHCDIGGGFEEHDLSDISLMWMAANVEDALSLNPDYLTALPSPVKPWGELSPHNSIQGIYNFAATIQRAVPTGAPSFPTNEYVHASVLEQKHIFPQLAKALHANPRLVAPLLPLEQQIKDAWVAKPAPLVVDGGVTTTVHRVDDQSRKSPAELLQAVKDGIREGKAYYDKYTNKKPVVTTTETGQPIRADANVGNESQWVKAIEESPMGSLIREFL